MSDENLLAFVLRNRAITVTAAQERIIKVMEDYFELTQFSVEQEGADPNPDWDAGFQAAIAIARGAKE
jgi:hypothetical protein